MANSFLCSYHPDAGWLKEHGYSVNLTKCVHIPNAADFPEPQGIHRKPWVALHKLAHGHHNQVLGFEELRVKAAWRKFRDSGKCGSVSCLSASLSPCPKRRRRAPYQTDGTGLWPS